MTVEGTALVTSENTGVEGWYPWIEIVGAGGTAPKARVCAFSYVDAPRLACPDRPAAVCAQSGSVTVDAIPTASDQAGLALSLDVTFPGGSTLTGSIGIAPP